SVGNGTSHVPHSHTGFRVALVGDLETKTAAAQPFVVLARGGKGERPRATPKDAVDAARSGDTIEIRGDGPFLVPPLVLRKKALTIRAAAGRRPVLRLNEEGLKAERSILIESDAALVLEGLELQRIAGPSRGVKYPGVVYTSGGAPLFMANCRVVATDPSHVVEVHNSRPSQF